MEKKKLPLLICANLLIIAAIGYVDYLSSSEIKIIAFYLIPVFLGTYYGGYGWGILFSALSILFSLSVDYSEHEALGRGIIINNIMLIIVYLFIVYLVNLLRVRNAAVKENLREKEMILRDIHHRIKNQMASLQAIVKLSGHEDPEKTSLDLSGRIHTYLQLYEHLSYESSSQSRINVHTYLQEMTEYIIKAFGTTVIPVSIVINGGNFEIENKQMVSIGLIINELVTNSLKYAFPATQEGSIIIEITRHKHGRLELVYRDSGRGFDFTGGRSKRKFGLKLVEMQVLQLNGDMRYSASQGSEYTFNFREMPTYDVT